MKWEPDELKETTNVATTGPIRRLLRFVGLFLSVPGNTLTPRLGQNISMSATRTAYPRLALPFTVIADGELLHLIAGEDVRYSIRAGSLASGLAVLLRRCDGRDPLDTLLLELPEADRSAARLIIERLYGERILIDGPVEQLSVANQYRLAVEGRGELADRLSGSAHTLTRSVSEGECFTDIEISGDQERSPSLTLRVSEATAVSVLCQDTLDPNAVLEFNRRCLRAGAGPWMWATTGPASRGFVSPVFLPNAGPCLECLVRHFQRLSPVPQLYEALARHGQQDGAFAAVPFPAEGLTILEQIVCWKLGQLSGTPHPAVFQLHVLELDSMEVSTHRVFLDPTCPECADARLV